MLELPQRLPKTNFILGVVVMTYLNGRPDILGGVTTLDYQRRDIGRGIAPKSPTRILCDAFGNVWNA